LVVTTPPIKRTREEALRSANGQRSEEAKQKALDMKAALDAGLPETDVARVYGYSNVKHMRAALKKHLPQVPQEVA
jgi:AraC-like DNA-binding protein